jgi:hypothetical protein
MEDGPRVIRDDMMNDRGELTFAEQTRMTRGPVYGSERACATPDDDPWYDVPPGSPVLPEVDTAAWGGRHARRRGYDPGVASKVSLATGGPDSVPAGPRPTVPQVCKLVAEWYARPGNEASGGQLHVILDDGNMDGRFLREYREKLAGDPLAVAILDALMRMSHRQRYRVYGNWWR